MFVLKSLALFGLAAVAVADVVTGGGKSAVLDLTPDNFDQVVLKTGKPSLVEFYAPWCGHCKALYPVYEELGHLFEKNNDVQIARVDADKHRDLGHKFGVQGFPTLKWFDGKSDKPTDYKGSRDIEGLSAWVTERTGIKPKQAAELPTDLVYLTDETFKELVGSDKNVFIAFTAPWCGHCKKLAPTWEQLARDFHNEESVVVAKVDAEGENSKTTAKAEGVSSYPTIKFYPAGSTEGEAYPGSRAEKDLVAFLNKKTGTHRLPGGGLDATAGTIDILGHIAMKFAAGGQALSDLAAEAKKAAASLGSGAQYKYAEYYVKVFDKLEKSDNYVAKELARLDGIMKKGGLAPAKLDEFKSRSNILHQFVDKVAEKVSDAKDEL